MSGRAGMRFAGLVGAVWLASGLAAPVAAQTLFSLEDPKGDDHGSGVLIYPNRDDMQPGDLDLVRFSAEQRGDGVWFVLEMAQAVRDPTGRVTELGQTPIERIARNGFYTFNVDIYVDTDRVAGSGEVAAVPGRGVTIDRNYAWERCLVLTPRPDIARTMLQLHFDEVFEAELRAKQGKVSKQEVEELQARSEQVVADHYFFATRVRVAGRRIEFLVPDGVLGGLPSQSWGYTVLVTGADLEQTSRPGQLTPERATMMTMAVARGIRFSQFGIRSDTDSATPPVVDLLAPTDEIQNAALTNYDIVAGRLAAMPGIAPDGKSALAASGAVATASQSSRVQGAAGGSAAGAPAERRTVPARLRTLSQLLEEGLITEAEFAELRRKILAEL